MPGRIAGGALHLDRDQASGQLTGVTIDGMTESFQYNDFGEPVNYATAFGGQDLYAVDLTRDRLGRITERSETVLGVTTTYRYGYDSTGRLGSVTTDGGPTMHLEYDSNDNRVAVTGPAGTVEARYDDRDQILRLGATTYTYTADGQLATRSRNGQTTRYAYDELGNMKAAELPTGQRIEYLIDGQNRRSGKRVNGNLVQAFLYGDHLGPVAELDANSNVVTRFVYATDSGVPDYLVRAGVTYRIIRDHLGSPRLVVDTATGDVQQRLDYNEAGQVVTDTQPGFQPFGYAGGIYDRDTELIHFGAREYDPQVGRWTSRNPLLFNADDANLYSYAASDPINFTDPTGLLVAAPGFWESLVPVWGPGRQAVHEFQCGNFLRAAFFAAIAISDLLWLKAMAKGIWLGAWKTGGHSWRRTSEWYAETRGVPRGGPYAPQIHHWLVPQKYFEGNRWGELIFNQPWNLMEMDWFTHSGIHLPGLGFGDWLRYGTPAWFKHLGFSASGRVGIPYD